jgi:hypothetical protein
VNATADHLCHVCVKDKFLKAEIKAEGNKAVCMRCGKTRLAMDFIELTLRIDEAIQEHWVPVEDDGQPYADLVAEQAQIDLEIADQMRQFLSNSRGYRAVKYGEDNIYDSSVLYDEGRLDRGPYLRGWEQFKESVKKEARFFNHHADEYLTDIFTGIEEQASWSGESVITTWKPTPVFPLVRGRVAESDADLQTFLSNPSQELGPPPEGTATAGRMNAAGVSTFYGALDVPTCRAEIRPPVGSHAVFACFELVREIRVLDVDALARIAVVGSIFDPDYSTRLARAAFLRNFGNEIARPVMPRDETFGYLPTQVVADYIAQRLGLDGMLYRSVQSGTERTSSGGYPQNIVLFHHAARVEPINVGRLKIEVDLGWIDEEEQDADDSISVREEELPPKRKPRKPEDLGVFQGIFQPVFEDGPPPGDDDYRKVTLRLMQDSISVQRIRGVDYNPSERHVSRRRVTIKAMREEKKRWAKLMGKRTRAVDPVDPF